jgi:hypothetical protein
MSSAILLKNLTSVLGVVVYVYNPNPQAVEGGGAQVQSQPGLHSETLSQKIKGWGCSSVVEYLPSTANNES